MKMFAKSTKQYFWAVTIPKTTILVCRSRQLRMSTNESFNNQLQPRLKEIRVNTIFVDQIDLFRLAEIKEGVVIVWANWSGPAIANCIATIHYLDSLNYSGKIYIVDNDDFNTTENNYNLFGKVLHGWGEIFIIKDGVITDEFLGKESFSRFKMVFGGDYQDNPSFG